MSRDLEAVNGNTPPALSQSDLAKLTWEERVLALKDQAREAGRALWESELDYSKEVFKKYRAHVINITDKLIEETAFLIEDHLKKLR